MIESVARRESLSGLSMAIILQDSTEFFIHLRNALDFGATVEEIADTVNVPADSLAEKLKRLGLI